MKTKRVIFLITVLLLALMGSLRELMALPMEKKSDSTRVAFPLPKAALERKQSASEDYLESNDRIERGTFPLRSEERDSNRASSKYLEDTFSQREKEIREPYLLTIDSIKVSLQKAPNASRFVLKNNHDPLFQLVAEEADPNKPREAKLEDNFAIRSFQASIETAFPQIDFSDLFLEGEENLSGSSQVLNSTLIESALERIDSLYSQSQNTKKLLKKEFEAQSFKTLPDRAVFWTGYLDGKGNQGRAEKYASVTNKQTIEHTSGGIWLNGKNLYRPDSVYASSDADLLWLSASRKFAKGASGHVVAFILKTEDPSSIYHGIEKHILKNNPEVFLSQNILDQNAKELLSQEQRQQLEQEAIIQKTLTWLDQAKKAWQNVSPLEHFHQENRRTTFFEELNQLTTTKPVLSELASLHPIFGEVTTKVEALLSTWDTLASILRALHSNNLLEAQATHQNDLFEQRSLAQGIETLPAWEEHYNWLRDATQSAGYYIFRGYKDQGNETAAKKWKERYRAFEEERFESLFENEEVDTAATKSIPRQISRQASHQAKEEEASKKHLEELHQRLLQQEEKAKRLAEVAAQKKYQGHATFTQANVYWDNAIAEAEAIITLLETIAQEEEVLKKATSSTNQENSWSEALQKTKAYQHEWVEKLELWKEKKEEFFTFKAAQKEKRALVDWHKASALSEKDSRFWKSWEKAIESAKEACFTYQDILNIPQKKNPLFLTKAKEQQEYWLAQLKQARVEPPLQLEPEEKNEVSHALTYEENLLPEPPEEDQPRLELRKKLDELLGEDQSLLTPETRSRCSSSNASDFMPIKASIDLDKEIAEIKKAWQRKVEEAEERRKETSKQEGKEPLNFATKKELFTAWKKHDQSILKVRKETQAQREKEARHARLAANWEQETRRLNTRARADELRAEFKLTDYAYFQHKQRRDDEDEEWETTNNRLIQELERLQEELEETRQDWEGMAEQHPKVLAAAPQGDESLREAKKQLKKSDRILVDLRRDFEDQVYQGVSHMRTRTMAPSRVEIQRCKKALLGQKEKALEALASKRLSIEEYANLLQREALKDAKDNISGNKEAWEELVQESVQKAASFKTTHGNNKESYQLEKIAASDRAGYETLLREMQYLEDVQQCWLDQLEELSEERARAAQSYWNNDPLSWIMLTPQERYYYNAPIAKAREIKAARELEEAQERARLAREEEERIQHSFLTSEAEKARIQKEKEEAYQNLRVRLKDQITQKESQVKAAYEEVERLHKSVLLFSSYSKKQKQQSIDELVKHVSSLIDLYHQLDREERKRNYEQGGVSFNAEREARLIRSEGKEKEEYLSWTKLTPKEKISKVKEVKNSDIELALERTIESELDGRIREALLFQKSVSYFALGKKAESQGKIDERDSWNSAGNACYSLANKLEKAIEAEADWKPDRAKQWREAAQSNLESVEFYVKAAEARSQGKTLEGTSWYNAGLSFNNSAVKLERAIYAKAVGKQDEVKRWQEIAQKNFQAVEWFVKAAEAYAQGKTDEGMSWNITGVGFCNSAEKLEQAIKAQVAGRPNEAKQWREAAEKHEQYHN